MESYGHLSEVDIPYGIQIGIGIDVTTTTHTHKQTHTTIMHNSTQIVEEVYHPFILGIHYSVSMLPCN